MKHVIAQMYLHIVFCTQKRIRCLTEELCEELYPYITGIIQKEKGELITIGGDLDHLHLLIQQPLQISLEDLVHRIKSRTSTMIKQRHHELDSFHWQVGYAAFGLSPNDVCEIQELIKDQSNIHKIKDYEDELIELMNEHELSFDHNELFE